MERMNITDPQDISPNPTANTTTVDPVERITVTVEQTTEPERCSSASTRLVQLSTTFDISDAIKSRASRDSECTDSRDSECHARDDEPEEILRRLEQQSETCYPSWKSSCTGQHEADPRMITT